MDIVLCVIVNIVEGWFGKCLLIEEIKMFFFDEIICIMESVVKFLLFYLKKL